MTKLLDMMAPRGWVDGLLRLSAFLLLINGLNWVLTVGVRGVSYQLGADLLNTTAVAIPFVFVCLATLASQRRLQIQLTLMATTDMLTGLLNRRAFLVRAHQATERTAGGALLLLDADHFKRVNDRWGHAVGDACLVAIAERLRQCLRPGDLMGRLGGEEFAAFLPGATPEEALRVGEQICEVIAVEAAGVEEQLVVTLSAGLALEGRPLDRLMSRADAALYQAKAQGRARLVMWSPPSKKDRAA